MNKKNLTNWKDIRKDILSKEELKVVERKTAYKVLIRKLKYVRVEKKLTQEQLSVLSGVPRSTIAKVENGVQNVSILKLQQIVEGMCLNLSIDLVERE